MDQAPPEGTVERWAWNLVCARELSAKLSPPEPPRAWEAEPPPRRIVQPGRPPELVAAVGRQKTPRAGALKNPERRAELLHRFLHHEIQAAELLAWAILAFPSAPPAFRRGLLQIARDEIRHVGLYAAHLERLGWPVGAFPVNDWFWKRVPLSETPACFVAVLGMGLEGGNLDHADRFAAQLRAAGDEEAAKIQEQVAQEEVPHVAFALHWFERLEGAAEFHLWRARLPAPLTPVMMRGPSLSLARRRAAGFSEAFLDELSRWTAASLGS